jgi:uncharacterized protein (DUF1697 family)
MSCFFRQVELLQISSGFSVLRSLSRSRDMATMSPHDGGFLPSNTGENMPRYIAFLRGVSPMNAKMPEVKRCFQDCGFTDVKTLLSSGNVVFDARSASESSLQRKAEAAMRERLGRAFLTIVRPAAYVRSILAADPYASFCLPANAKRVVTFLLALPGNSLDLPVELDGARILAMQGREIFTAYVPTPRGPVFMSLIERTFGTDITTRTWDTVKKCAVA